MSRRDIFIEERKHRGPFPPAGEVSWLKAALFDDVETFIPEPVSRVRDCIGEGFVLLTEEKLAAILADFHEKNATQYGIARGKEGQDFLLPYLGSEIFTISW